MILCVSIGNTNIRCALGGKEHNQQIIIPTKTVSHPEDFINNLEEQYEPDIWTLVQGSIVSSVVPLKTSIITNAIYQKTNKLSQLINMSNCNLDISKYKSKLGEDRAICCAAALSKYKPPIAVIDLGTATTINVINADGVFLGGAICVGIQTGLKALSKYTSQLPQINDFSNVCVIGKDTHENLVSGAIIGTIGLIEGYINHIRTELGGTTPTIIITGGNAPHILPHCRFDFIHEPTLLIDGLFMLYKEQ